MEKARRAGSLALRLSGLLLRPRLCAGEGLWLVPCRMIHTLGMRYAIDAIYLDRELKVVGLQQGLRPFRLGKVYRGAHSVLEMLPGAIATSRTRVGDQLGFDDQIRLRG